MRFRHSQVYCFKQCPAKCYYKYKLGLQRKGTGINPDLNFGTAVHEAIAALHNEGYEAAVDLLHNWEFPPHRIKTKHAAKMLLNRYVRDRRLELICAEKDFSFKLGDHEWFGRFDGVGKLQNGLYIVEAKTTKPMWLMMKPNDQFISYWRGGKEYYEDILGVLVESLDPETLNVVPMVTDYSEEEYDEWELEMLSVLDNYVKCDEDGIWPRCPGTCLNFGRTCSYHGLCSTDKGTRQYMIENTFEINEQHRDLAW